MAFSLAQNIGGTVSLAHHKSVYLSRETGYDVSFVQCTPSISDPAGLIHSSVRVKREDGLYIDIIFPDDMELAVIAKDIKNIKWPQPIKDTKHCIDRPSSDMVEYIIQFKKEQEQQKLNQGAVL